MTIREFFRKHERPIAWISILSMLPFWFVSLTIENWKLWVVINLVILLIIAGNVVVLLDKKK